MKRRTLILVASVIMMLSFQTTSSAQDYYGRDRRDSSADRYRYGDLKASVKRIDRLSGQLKNDVDRALDRSKLDGKSREDRINDVVNDFHSAAAEFKDKFDDGRDLDRAQREAQRVLDLGYQLDRIMERGRLSRTVEMKWSQIMSDLRVIQSAYESRSAYNDNYGYRN